MNVPLLDLQTQYASLRDEMRQAIDRVFESQRFVLGEEVQKLEASIAAYCETKHAVALCFRIGCSAARADGARPRPRR